MGELLRTEIIFYSSRKVHRNDILIRQVELYVVAFQFQEPDFLAIKRLIK